MAQDKIPVEISTPHGTVAWKEVSEPAPPKVAAIVRELTSKELASLNQDAESGGASVAKYVPANQRENDLLLDLDLVFEAWLRSSRLEKEAESEIIRMLGAAYGQYCIERLGVRWAVIKDEHGTDLALVRENPTARGFPFSSIQYRIEDKETNFLYALYASLKHLIEESKRGAP